MSVWQTFLVFACIPAGVIALVILAVYGKAILRQPNRYRPGRPWNYEPAWYVPHPEAIEQHAGQPAGATTAVGGASGEW